MISRWEGASRYEINEVVDVSPLSLVSTLLEVPARYRGIWFGPVTIELRSYFCSSHCFFEVKIIIKMGTER